MYVWNDFQVSFVWSFVFFFSWKKGYICPFDFSSIFIFGKCVFHKWLYIYSNALYLLLLMRNCEADIIGIPATWFYKHKFFITTEKESEENSMEWEMKFTQSFSVLTIFPYFFQNILLHISILFKKSIPSVLQFLLFVHFNLFYCILTCV